MKPPEPAPHRLRWWILALLFLAMTINILDRQVLSLVAPVLRDELHLSNTQYGTIVFCFLLGMTVAQIPVGMMMDRYGARLGFSLVIAWWSAANMPHAGARTVAQFSALRFLLGVGECGTYSAGVKAIGQWFPARERALAAGVFNSGSLAGAVLAPPLIVYLMLHHGWPSAFLIPSITGFLWLLPWLRVYWEPWRHPKLSAAEREAARPAVQQGQAGGAPSIRQLLRVRAVWGVILMRAFGGPVTHFYWYWLPEYLKRERGMSLEMIGLFAWMPFFSGGVGNIGGGWFSSRLIARGWSVDRARKTAFLIAGALCLSAVLVPAAPDAAWAMTFICLASLGINALAANLMGLITDLFPQSVLARVSGMTGVGDGAMSMTMMQLTGVVVDRFSYLPVFVAAGAFPLASLASLFLLVGNKWPTPPAGFERRTLKRMNPSQNAPEDASRRRFLAASAAALPLVPGARAAGDRIRLGLIGCGGRGSSAALEAMEADPGVQLVAAGDLLADRAQEKRTLFKTKRPEQAVLGEEHSFGGFDAYKRVIELSDVVIIANAAKFHPMQMTAAIRAGKHVFVEKPHAIDPSGIKAVEAACALAKQKNLCVVSGLHSRYDASYRETVQRVHDGAIGRITHIEENFLRAPYVLYPRRPGLGEVEWQGSNQYHFHWLSGDDVTQSLVHNLDRASWLLGGASPLRCHGMGGRSTIRGEQYGNVFDHHSVVYEFPGGVRVYALCRTIPGCYNEYSSVAFGTKGSCNVMKMQIAGENPWKYAGPPQRAHFNEHVELYKALRAGRRIHNGDYMARSTLIAIMGQIACYSGQEVTWEQVTKSDFCFLPRPEDVRAGMEPPVRPDAQGIYPPAFTPGVSKLL